jgi:hypothetical protein
MGCKKAHSASKLKRTTVLSASAQMVAVREISGGSNVRTAEVPFPTMLFLNPPLSRVLEHSVVFWRPHRVAGMDAKINQSRISHFIPGFSSSSHWQCLVNYVRVHLRPIAPPHEHRVPQFPMCLQLLAQRQVPDSPIDSAFDEV